MPRKPRDFVAGGIYHTFNRGNNQAVLFEDRKDFDCFKAMLYDGKERAKISIFHYCLMRNHFHLLLRSEEEQGLPRFMHWVQLGYARYFKKKRQTTGHVFEERYRSPRISEESYYLQCGRYIERNPVQARLVTCAAEYPYSSAGYYAKGCRDLLITENVFYANMGENEKERQENYKKFLFIQDPYAEMIENQLLKY